MADRAQHDVIRRELAVLLHDAWKRYTDAFNEPPHGTTKQMNCLVKLLRLDDLVKGIERRAISRWYAESQGKTTYLGATPWIPSRG